MDNIEKILKYYINLSFKTSKDNVNEQVELECRQTVSYLRYVNLKKRITAIAGMYNKKLEYQNYSLYYLFQKLNLDLSFHLFLI